MIDITAQVIENRETTAGYRLLTLEFDKIFNVHAGQFAMLRAHDAYEPLLRRALAIYDAPSPERLSFLYQVLGKGTQALAQVAEGGSVDALLPLGNCWPLPDEMTEPIGAEQTAGLSMGDDPVAVVAAGGIGSASLLMLGKMLRTSEIETHIFFGAASEQAAIGCGLDDFYELGLPLTVSTDDGSLGEPGLITVPLERFLGDYAGRNIMVYACGPWPMMGRTAQLAAKSKAKCLVSLEAPMACGIGICVGCVFAVKDSEPLGYGTYKRVCTDGTIFPAEEVNWEINAMAH